MWSFVALLVACGLLAVTRTANGEVCIDTPECRNIVTHRALCDLPEQKRFIEINCRKLCGFCNFSRLDGGETGLQVPVSSIFCNDSAEIVFVLDASSSVGDVNFQKVRKFTEDVTQRLKSEYFKLNVTVITFSNEAKVTVQLNESVDLNTMLTAEGNITYTHGGTQTHKALELMYQVFNNDVNSSKIAIVVTDGASFEPSLTRQAAEFAKSHGVSIFVVAVGDDVNPHETKDISSDPDERYLHLLRSFSDLESIVGVFHTKNCTNRETTTTTTTEASLTSTTVKTTVTETVQTKPSTTVTQPPGASTKHPTIQTGGTPTAKPIVQTGKTPTAKPPFINPSSQTVHVGTPGAVTGKTPTPAPVTGKPGEIPSLIPPLATLNQTARPTVAVVTNPLSEATVTVTDKVTPKVVTSVTETTAKPTSKSPETTVAFSAKTSTKAPTTASLTQPTTTTKVAITHTPEPSTTAAATQPTTKSSTPAVITTQTPAKTASTTQQTTTVTKTSTSTPTTTVATAKPTTTTTVATSKPPATTAATAKPITTTTVVTTQPTTPKLTTTTTVATQKMTTSTTVATTTPTTQTTIAVVKTQPSTANVDTTQPPQPTAAEVTTKKQPITHKTTTVPATLPSSSPLPTAVESTIAPSSAEPKSPIVVTHRATTITTDKAPIVSTKFHSMTATPVQTTAAPPVKTATSPKERTEASTRLPKTQEPARTTVEASPSATSTTQEPTTTTTIPETTSTTPPSTTTASCIAKVADIVFVVDTSGSIGLTNFEKVKAFIKQVILTFDVDSRYTRVGLIEYSTDAHIEFKLHEKTNLTELLEAVDNVTYTGGGTSTSDALELMRVEGFDRERPLAPDVAVVITDGLSKFPSLTRAQADLAKADGITMFSIGIGNETARAELIAIATDKRYVFEVGDYETLLSLDNVVAHRACGIVLPEEYHSRGPTTISTTPKGCVDLDANCVSYPRDSCTDYEPYARKNCARKCGYCPGHPISEPECEDTEPNCAQYGTSMCFSSSQYDWVDEHCRKFCGFCGNKTEIQATAATTPATTVVTTESSCHDIEPKCAKYGGTDMCKQPSYEAWAKYNCRKYCGYCFTYHTVTSATVNKVKCPEWTLPEQCTLDYSGGQCCPFPKCPDGFRLTIKRHLK